MFLLHASRRVVLAFSLDGHLYPIGALIMAATILDHWGLLNTLNGIPIAHTHVQSVGEKILKRKKIQNIQARISKDTEVYMPLIHLFCHSNCVDLWISFCTFAVSHNYIGV